MRSPSFGSFATQAVAKKEKKVKAPGAAVSAAPAGASSEERARAAAEAAHAAQAAHPKSQVELAVSRARSGIDELPEGFERPVIIHRAILGSVERFLAVLIEHTAGKWPLWLSPRQVAIVPVALKYLDYAQRVAAALQAEGFFVDVDTSHHTLNKKVREAQVTQFNFILVVGAAEEAAGSVAIRTRDNAQHGTKSIVECVAILKELVAQHQ